MAVIARFIGRRSYLRPLAGLVILAIASMLVSCHGAQRLQSEYERYIDGAEDVWKFQGSYLVAVGDSIMARGSRGFANIADRRLNTPDTKFLIASLTKPFTAIAVMQLVQRELIDLNRDITAYIDCYRPGSEDTITVHDLLCHRSGIPDVLSNQEFASRIRDTLTPLELVSYFQGRPILFTPGSQYSYSSSNYILLGLIIEAVTKTTWENYILTHICRPAGMNNTGVFPDAPSRSDFAKGYTRYPSGAMTDAPPIHPSLGYAAGALASTVDDLNRLNRALSDTTLLDRRFRDTMFVPYSPTYGYGWIVDDFGGHRLIAHGGGAPGYVSIFQHWPDDSVCVIVFSNNGAVPVHEMADALAAIALHEPYEMPRARQPMAVSLQVLAEYEGTYRLSTGESRRVFMKDGKAYAQRGLDPARLILPESRDNFYFARDEMTTLEFLREADGAIIGQIIRQAFDSDTAWRTD